MKRIKIFILRYLKRYGLHWKLRSDKGATNALKKMAKVAGYKYEDCINGKNWLYGKGWTLSQRDRYKKWFYIQMASEFTYKPDNTWGMWDLMYGFKEIDR